MGKIQEYRRLAEGAIQIGNQAAYMPRRVLAPVTDEDCSVHALTLEAGGSRYFQGNVVELHAPVRIRSCTLRSRRRAFVPPFLVLLRFVSAGLFIVFQLAVIDQREGTEKSRARRKGWHSCSCSPQLVYLVAPGRRHALRRSSHISALAQQPAQYCSAASPDFKCRAAHEDQQFPRARRLAPLMHHGAMTSRPCPTAPGRARSACAAVACCIWAQASSEPFIGQFELKTLESAAGSMEFQSQNAWSSGQPERAWIEQPDGEVLYDENSLLRARYALELEIGLTKLLKMRIGIEAEDERVDEAASPAYADDFEGLELQEIGAELIAVFVAREDDGFGAGVVVEIEGPLDQEEPNNLVIGSILEYQRGAWLLAAVPMLVRSFGGDTDEGAQRDEKWDFAYAAQITRALSDRWSIALEGYGTLERLGDSGTPSPAATLFGDFDQHRLGPVVYYQQSLSGDAEIALGIGVLEGLNADTADHTMKLSIEIDF